VNDWQLTQTITLSFTSALEVAMGFGDPQIVGFPSTKLAALLL